MAQCIGIYGIGRLARQLIYDIIKRDDFPLCLLVELEGRTPQQIAQYLSNTTEDNLGWHEITIGFDTSYGDNIIINGVLIPIIYEEDPTYCHFDQYGIDYAISTTIPADFEISGLNEWGQLFIYGGARTVIIATDIYQSSYIDYYLYGIKNFPTATLVPSFPMACVPNGEDSAYYYAVEIINQISGCTVTSVNGTMLARGITFSSGDSFNNVNLKHNILEDAPSNISNLGAIFPGLSSVPANSSKYRVDTKSSLVLIDLIVQYSDSLTVDMIAATAKRLSMETFKGILGYTEDPIECFNTEDAFITNDAGSRSVPAVSFAKEAVKVTTFNTGYYVVRMAIIANSAAIMSNNILENIVYRIDN